MTVIISFNTGRANSHTRHILLRKEITDKDSAQAMYKIWLALCRAQLSMLGEKRRKAYPTMYLTDGKWNTISRCLFYYEEANKEPTAEVRTSTLTKFYTDFLAGDRKGE